MVCAASYEARQFGVHSAMPMATARRLCPEAVFLPVRMAHYAQIARQIREIFLTFTPLVEPLSLDEAFLDVRGCEGLFGPAPAIARQIKASSARRNGPDRLGRRGAQQVPRQARQRPRQAGRPGRPACRTRSGEFLTPLPVGRIWGVGAKGEQRLHALGIRTIGQLAGLPERVLIDHFGEAGRHLWQLAHGHDDRTVVPDREAKSISTETTFAHDLADREALRTWLLELVDQLAGRLRQQALRARTIELKIRSSDFRTRRARARCPRRATPRKCSGKPVRGLFERHLAQDTEPVRLLGVGATRLTRGDGVQGDLFDDGHRQRQGVLDRTLDAIRDQFGKRAIRRASGLAQPEEDG